MKITDLFARRANAWEEAKKFLDTHTQDNGTMTAEDAATYERMEADITNLTKQIERQQRLDDMENAMKQPTSAPITNKPMSGDESKTGRASDAYRKAFDSYMRGRVFSNDLTPMIEGTPARGGYLVPEEFERQVVSDILEMNVIRPVSKVIRTAGDHKIPVAKTHSVASWMGEGAAYIESNPTFDQETLSAFKLGVIITASEELLQDSMINVESYIGDEIARAFAIGEETAFCIGDGTTGPTGIFTSKGGNVGVTAAKVNEIAADELISLVYALKAPYRRNARFIMKDSTVGAIRKLKDGNGVYMWQPALTNGQPDKLLGYDLLTSAYAPAIEAGALVAAFGDFKNYWIADRAGLSIQRLNERYADLGLVGFRAYERCDAKVIMPDGIQLLKMKTA